MSVRYARASKSTIGEFLHPTHGVRDAARRRGEKPKDFAADNVRAMRAIERANREAREVEASTYSSEFKMKRFADVKPRVMEASVAPPGPAKRTTARSTFVKKGSGPVSSREVTKMGMAEVKSFVRPAPSTKPPVPRADEVAELAPRTEKNFITGNAKTVITTKPPSRPTSDEASRVERPRDYGRVPRYLEERKAEAEEYKAYEEARRGDPDCPPGMRLMPESERLETLAVLQTSLEEVKKQIFKMPLVIETAGQVRRKNALEAKLKEIEDACKIFDRPKVFVQDD